jgi:ankyrin repeat protein
LARDVIAKFDSSDFWALCGNYSSFAAGNPTTAFRVRLGNRVKTLTNYANSAPRWLGDLEYVVDDAADTHRWLHGDPREEPLSRIEDDGDGPKPGLTPLMRAAARGDVGQVKMLLKKGADVNQADASGWTVLMYARTREYGGEGSSVVNSDLIPLLLAAGADPNYSSPRGDTPLMAAAYDERFEMTLVKAGAKVNAQNADGISVLMILAAKAEAGEIERALRAGADPKLKDAQGRTALDYLNLANCAESPLQNSSDKMAIQEGDQCRSLYQDDFQKSEKLLNMSATISVP